MATKGYKDNEQQAFTPTPTDWLGIQQGSLLSDMKKITYKDLTDPLQGQIDDHEQRVDDLELAEGSIKGVGWTGASLQSLDENKADKATTYTKTEVDVTIDALDGRLDTLEGTGAGSVAKAIDDGIAEVTDQAVKTNSTPSFNGIKFPATQVLSSDPNTLDDYEEGTWTPTIQGGVTAGSHVYGTQVGHYVKIGGLVFVSAFVSVTTKDASMDGVVSLSSLPFVASVPSYPSMSVAQYSGITLASGKTQLGLNIRSSWAELNQSGSNSPAAVVNSSALAGNFSIIASGVYRT